MNKKLLTQNEKVLRQLFLFYPTEKLIKDR